MIQKPILESSDAQLRAFAESVLNLEVPASAERSALISLIETAWVQDYIMLEEPANEPQGSSAAAQPTKTFDLSDHFGPPTTFRIMQTEQPGGKHPAHPDVNGKMLVMQRNMLITAPYAFYLALRNAVAGSVVQGPDVNGRPGEHVVTEVSNYPLSDVKLPPQDEIEAWHAQNGARELAA